MMDDVSPETCWTSRKYEIKKYFDTLAYCWIFFVNVNLLPTFWDQVIPKLLLWITTTRYVIKRKSAVFLSSTILSLKPSQIKTSVNEDKKNNNINWFIPSKHNNIHSHQHPSMARMLMNVYVLVFWLDKSVYFILRIKTQHDVFY
jgi:hypothetical protein